MARGHHGRNRTRAGVPRLVINAGREDAKAEPWLYLRRVQHRAAPDGPFEEMAQTHGLLIHRDQIKRVRVFTAEGEDAAPVAVTSGAEAVADNPDLASPEG